MAYEQESFVASESDKGTWSLPVDGDNVLRVLSSMVKKMTEDIGHLSLDIFRLKEIVKRLDKNEALAAPIIKEVSTMITKLSKVVCDHDDLLMSQESAKVDIKKLYAELDEVKQQLAKIQNVVDSNLEFMAVDVNVNTEEYLRVSYLAPDSQKRRQSWPLGVGRKSLTIGAMIESLADKIKSIEGAILQMKPSETPKTSQVAFIETTALKEFVEQQIEENRLRQEDTEQRDRTFSTDSGFQDTSFTRQRPPSTPREPPIQPLTSTPSSVSNGTGSMVVNQISTIPETVSAGNTFRNDTPRRSHSLSRTASTFEIHDPRFDTFLVSLLNFLAEKA